MKKLNTILILFLLCVAISFSQVNDNIDVNKTGTGSFSATILMPLTISDAGDAFLGEFVKSDIPYTPDDALFESTILEFMVSGEPGYEFFYKIIPNFVGEQEGDVAEIEIGTLGLEESGGFGGFGGFATQIFGEQDYADILNEEGDFLITLQVLSVKANGSGTDTFLQTIEVSYNSF